MSVGQTRDELDPTNFHGPWEALSRAGGAERTSLPAKPTGRCSPAGEGVDWFACSMGTC